MTLKELRQIIAESPNKDIFSTHKISFRFSKTGINREFDGISSFFEYLLNQSNGFDQIEGEIPGEIQESKTYFVGLTKRTKDFITNYHNIRSSEFAGVWNQQIATHINSHINYLIFEFDAPNTSFLLEIFKFKKSNYQGARDFLTNSVVVNELSKRDYLNGVILAYEYFQKGETEIKKRRDNEKSSLSKFRSHIDEYISQGEKDFIDYSASLKERTDSTIDEVIAYKTKKSEEYEKWFGETSSSFSDFDTASKKKITELENLYQEKLKLEAPAQYWNKRARALKIEGRWWLAGLILTISVGVSIFLIALNWLADGVLAEIFNDTASAIKWSVIFITLVSFLAFLIKTLSKMTFSTFHLSRDAEEREQLTYVFLAMQKEKAVDPTERHLIMQSLFSRADTGLLKDDGSPTMPGNIFDKVIAGSNGR